MYVGDINLYIYFGCLLDFFKDMFFRFGIDCLILFLGFGLVLV